MNKNQQRPTTIWPYLAILACLFVLSVTAPRAWDRMERRESLSELLGKRTSRPAGEAGREMAQVSLGVPQEASLESVPPADGPSETTVAASDLPIERLPSVESPDEAEESAPQLTADADNTNDAPN